jgi:hypothetical protein
MERKHCILAGLNFSGCEGKEKVYQCLLIITISLCMLCIMYVHMYLDLNSVRRILSFQARFYCKTIFVLKARIYLFWT